jgi:hypothetical protein
MRIAAIPQQNCNTHTSHTTQSHTTHHTPHTTHHTPHTTPHTTTFYKTYFSTKQNRNFLHPRTDTTVRTHTVAAHTPYAHTVRTHVTHTHTVMHSTHRTHTHCTHTPTVTQSRSATQSRERLNLDNSQLTLTPSGARAPPVTGTSKQQIRIQLGKMSRI